MKYLAFILVRSVVLLALLAGWLSPAILGQSPPSSLPREDLWITDGPVHAILETNGVIYLGGDFSNVAPHQPATALLDAINGLGTPGFPHVHGVVHAAVPDGEGGWFIGGAFHFVGDQPRTNLARVRSDFTVDTVWNPGANDIVHALALASGTLYVGGQFTNVAGLNRSKLAALDPATGAATAWHPNVCCDVAPDNRSRVLALEVGAGRVFAGGFFSQAGGVPCNNIAALDTTNGLALAWPLEPQDPNSFVATLRLDGPVLYAGGRFQFIGAALRNNLAALDPVTGVASSWDANADGNVLALAVRAGTIFVGGAFSGIGGATRANLAALDSVTGLATTWNPAPDGEVRRLVLSGNTLHAAGSFNSAAAQSRIDLASFDADSGQLTPWNPTPPGRSIRALALHGGLALISANTQLSALPRRNLVALDAITGRPLNWNPGADGAVFALAYGDGTLFAGGDFQLIAGEPRLFVAAINGSNGEALPWATSTNGPNGRVSSLALGFDRLFVAGAFTSVGTIFSPGLTALDRLDGQSLGWRPVASRPVASISLSDSTLYTAGNFTSIGGQQRRAFAALDGVGSVALNWNPNARGPGLSGAKILTAGSTLYTGGVFTNIGGQPRRALAAISASTALATSWNPSFGSSNDSVHAMSVRGNVLYVAGSFSSIAGQTRSGLAAIDRTTALPFSWNPAPQQPSGDAAVSLVEAGARAIYIGGPFTVLGGRPRPHFAAFVSPDAPVITNAPAAQAARLGQSATFSVRASGQTPLSYQWRFNGTNLAGATSANLTLSNVQLANAGAYSVIVTNVLGLALSEPVTLTVTQPLAITSQPTSRSVFIGADTTFNVAASGSPAPYFQWRLNGMTLPGQTAPALTLSNLQATNGGLYSVVLYNGIDTIESQAAELIPNTTALTAANNFASRLSLGGGTGGGSVQNSATTKEAGEPNHTGKPGGRSVWFSWTAPASGIATFDTRGSAFDTLLAVYTNTTVSGTNVIAADDDRGGFFTSLVAFNATAGVEYQIVIDGYHGVAGRAQLNWSLETTGDRLPRIATQPASQLLEQGANATLRVTASAPSQLSYQWLHNGEPIPGATSSLLSINGMTPELTGDYSALVRAGNRVVETQPATIEIGSVSGLLSQDKFQDCLPISGTGFFLATNLVTGRQIFQNTGAGTQSGEPHHGGMPGGSSRWMRLRAATNGVMLLDTLGSGIDTTLAVYTGTNLAALYLVARDNNGATDRARSFLRFNATPGIDYFVAVDGVNRDQGVIQLNWLLGQPPTALAAAGSPAVRQGGSLVLSANTGGAIPAPSYQWRFNGILITGATNSTLTLTNFQSTQAGTYSVIVSNLAGTLTNTVAFVSYAPPFRVSYERALTNGRTVLRLRSSITNTVVLEASTNLTLWTPVHSISNLLTLDYTEPGATNFPRRFYRVFITPPARMNLERLPVANGSQFRLRGPVNQSLIIEATTNLQGWTPIQTNALTMPIDFTDTAATNLPRRFYRLMPQP